MIDDISEEPVALDVVDCVFFNISKILFSDDP